MNILAVDVTEHLKLLFNVIYDCYNFLNSIEFTAFGFNFTLLGLLLSLIVLIALIKFMKFGFESSVSSDIKYMRKENKSDYLPKHREKRDVSNESRYDSKWI